ncbi:MAG: serine/threonine protein kinase, partial [Cyanobacteria bacterium HKST-UBA01]|nr:serine/threonine protein kinase [Cyanobacteria bacterium HKST-UBA01]
PVQVRLVDFGLAKNLSDEELSLTRTGLILGSPYYMSPEQIRGADTDARSDIYSFGCLAYKVLTGAVPFAGKDALETMDSHLKKIPRSLLELDPDLPPEIDELIQKCLAKDPESRFQDVSSLRAALAGVKEAVTPEDVLVEAETEAVADSISTRRIHPALLVVPTLVGVIVLFAVCGVLFKHEENESIHQYFEQAHPSMLAGLHPPKVKAENLKAMLGKDRTLKLESSELTPEVLAELPRLQGLVVLSVENSNLTDSALKSIAACHDIQELKLSSNKNISPEALSVVSEMPFLGKLELVNMDLEDAHLDSIAKAKRLFSLDISMNSGINAGALRRLQSLNGLQNFILGNEKIPMEEIVAFCNEKRKLTCLGLRRFPTPRIDMEKAADLKYVCAYDLSYNKEVDRAALEALLKAPKVNSLNLSSTIFPTRDVLVLNDFPAIKVVNLKRRGMEPSDVDILVKLRHLERLQLEDNLMITPEDCARIKRETGIKVIDKER